LTNNNFPTLLITGASGFAGRHLLEYIAKQSVPGTTVHATFLKINGQANPPEFKETYLPHLSKLKILWHELDAANLEQCQSVVKMVKPEWVIHLAGQAFVPYSWSDPASTYNANILGTHHLLKALKEQNFQGRFLYVSSGEVYGEFEANDLPLAENLMTKPQNPYSVSKLAAEHLSLLMAKSGNFEAIVARPFNHIGPAQTQVFVVPEFLQKVRQAKIKGETSIAMGNVDVQRDFSDVRDVVAAYIKLVQHGRPGEVYNICSGKKYTIRSILEHLCQEVGIQLQFTIDPNKLRPNEKHEIYASNHKLREHTGWNPQFSLEESLHFLVQHTP